MIYLNLRLEIEHICSAFGIILRPEMGQHFIISERIIDLEVKVADLKADDVALDIGAGLGYLTEELAKIARKVYAIEIDEKLVSAMRWRLRNSELLSKIEIIQCDVLKYEFPQDVNVIVSNPPYNIISQLIIKMLKESFIRENFRHAILILQQDYVKKLLSNPGSKNWGRISAAFKYFAKGKIIEFIPRKYFFPTPDVDSMMIKIWPDRKQHKVRFEVFEKTTSILFSASTNKKIRSILKQFIKEKVRDWRDLLAKLERKINMHKRIREITVEEIEEIASFLLEQNLIAMT